MGIRKTTKDMIVKFGSSQLIIAIEELSELQKELTKNLRGYDNKKHIVEEIADVQLVLEELKEYFKISQEDIYKVKLKKIKRTKRLYLSDSANEEKIEENQNQINLFECLGENKE